MARLCVTPRVIEALYKQLLTRNVLEQHLAEVHWQQTCNDWPDLVFSSEHKSLALLAGDFASLFRGVDQTPLGQKSRAWRVFQEDDFWLKNLTAEVGHAAFRSAEIARGATPQDDRDPERTGFLFLGHATFNRDMIALPITRCRVEFPNAFLPVVFSNLCALQGITGSEADCLWSYKQQVQVRRREHHCLVSIDLGTAKAPLLAPDASTPKVKQAFMAGVLHVEYARRVAAPLIPTGFQLELLVPTPEQRVPQSTGGLDTRGWEHMVPQIHTWSGGQEAEETLSLALHNYWHQPLSVLRTSRF